MNFNQNKEFIYNLYVFLIIINLFILGLISRILKSLLNYVCMHLHKLYFFNYQRQSKGDKTMHLGRAARQCLAALHANEIIALAADRDFTEKGIILDFFGRPTIFPKGPAEFSLKTGAPIIPCFMLRNPDDSFTLRMEKPIEFTPSGNKQNNIIELTKKCIDVIEGYIRKYPDQWYMFRQFWASR